MPILNTTDGDINYTRQGFGPSLIIALHGYGDNCTVFKSFQDTQHFTLLAIDLPFHGNTHWTKSTFQIQELTAVIVQLLTIEGHHHFIAVGHSLGGRLWLSLLPHFATQIRQLYLLAPDGLNTSGMALVDWMPISMRLCLSKLLNYPNVVLKLIHFLSVLKLINRFSYRYLKYQLIDQNRLISMRNTWCSLTYFPMNARIARKNILSASISICLCLGSKDIVVSAEQLRIQLQHLPSVSIVEYDTTHRGLVKKCLEDIPLDV